MKTILQILGLLFANLTGFAQWSTDPTQGNLIRQGSNTIEDFTLHTDNNGGTFLVWEDWRTFGPNIYVQRITAEGLPKWDENEGHIVRPMQGNEEMIASIADIGSTSDGNGNAIIAWSDDRDGSQVYVQKINGTGEVQWQTGGQSICTNCASANRVRIISDGSGGAIIAWNGEKAFGEANEVYIQRINENGVSQWQSNGIKVTQSEEYGNDFLNIVSDENGGAIITWEQNLDVPYMSGPGPMLAQRFDQNGNALWNADGVVMGIITPGIQQQPSSVTDGNGGIITVWYDVRNASGNLYAQRINSDGQLQWTLGGLPVCTANENQIYPLIVTDTQGGAIIAWQDQRNGTSNNDIYAQRINASGQAQWTADGIPVCAQSSDQLSPHMTPDGEGGAVICWNDSRNASAVYNNLDVYAQRLNSSGALMWESNGAPVSIGEERQVSVAITTDDNGGFVIIWLRDASIFASRLSKDGLLPVTLISFNVHKENTNAVLTWTTSQETNNKGFEIERSADGKHFEKIGFINPYSSGSDTTQNYQFLDTSPLAGSNYYRLKQLDHDGKFAYSKMVHVNHLRTFQISVYPNPTIGDLFVETEHVSGRLQVIDMLGRTVLDKRVVKPRTHINVKDLSPGMYIIKGGALSQVFVKQ
ncbi:T9SS type A sorting domain-containing protein [Dyadobacter chenwenxiniae]|uniref:T9SS type A sorting domain-containing protein n=1 Tax=Dyadobacter chenwenxiniae TaxID=2906456 RepID=A0A9X1PJ52_9BACT|nr:T9SS type A sorting domain-containing protein [Dyadobacter chenwenxiniae]MCF0061995.1 T9SS type A sorting domain-containing protein [Dyadobacter chenwenxiniae]UON81806.1 T9SS type A sorting domain-containing protein [Dyadobacter chenwenxiniae]